MTLTYPLMRQQRPDFAVGLLTGTQAEGLRQTNTCLHSDNCGTEREPRCVSLHGTFPQNKTICLKWAETRKVGVTVSLPQCLKALGSVGKCTCFTNDLSSYYKTNLKGFAGNVSLLPSWHSTVF